MNAKGVTVSFVVDSDPASGRGHLSRCLLLASAMREQGAECRFYPTHPVKMPGLDHFPVTVFSEMGSRSHGIVVVDGYKFDSQVLGRVKNMSDRLVLIDDLADRPFPADLVLNHNIYAERLDYSAYTGAQLLLGPDFALVRPEFFQMRGHSTAAIASRVLVTFGNGPFALQGIELAIALQQETDVNVDLVLGSENLTGSMLPREGITVHAWADLAKLGEMANLVICGLGVTFLEFVAAKKPVIGVQVADNQRLAHERAVEAGCHAFDHLSIKDIVECASQLIKGDLRGDICNIAMNSRGPERAASAILKEY